MNKISHRVIDTSLPRGQNNGPCLINRPVIWIVNVLTAVSAAITVGQYRRAHFTTPIIFRELRDERFLYAHVYLAAFLSLSVVRLGIYYYSSLSTRNANLGQRSNIDNRRVEQQDKQELKQHRLQEQKQLQQQKRVQELHGVIDTNLPQGQNNGPYPINRLFTWVINSLIVISAALTIDQYRGAYFTTPIIFRELRNERFLYAQVYLAAFLFLSVVRLGIYYYNSLSTRNVNLAQRSNIANRPVEQQDKQQTQEFQQQFNERQRQERVQRVRQELQEELRSIEATQGKDPKALNSDPSKREGDPVTVRDVASTSASSVGVIQKTEVTDKGRDNRMSELDRLDKLVSQHSTMKSEDFVRITGTIIRIFNENGDVDLTKTTIVFDKDGYIDVPKSICTLPESEMKKKICQIRCVKLLQQCVERVENKSVSTARYGREITQLTECFSKAMEAAIDSEQRKIIQINTMFVCQKTV